MFDAYLNHFKWLIDWEKYLDPYVGLRIVEVGFKAPYLQCVDYEMIALAVLQLLMKYAYNTEFEYGKFTIGYVMKIPTGDVAYTIGTAISLNDKSGNVVPNVDVYAKILKLCIQKVEDYDKALLSGISIRVYLRDGCGESQEVEAMGRKSRYPNHVPALKPTTKERRPFIVADTKMVLINNVHVPYDVGFIVLRLSDNVGDYSDYAFETYFSEDDLP
ncbi:hypothetical protein SUGI_1151380 [Cryptomeria japonica]|nr:hypothetical protein SUGI_1151380 [Cryptomeria japonica]